MNVLIVGGGIVGSFLGQSLAANHRITMIEKNGAFCERFSNEVAEAKVICEDGCEPWVLESTDIKNMDLVVATTGDDEDNLVISYLSKHEYGVPLVVARVNNPKNLWLYTDKWGVDVSVSAAGIMAKVIEEEISLGEVVTLMKLRRGDVALMEITVPQDSIAVGQNLNELELPPETLVVTVVRREQMLIPKADTTIEPGDKVLAITHARYEEDLERILGKG